MGLKHAANYANRFTHDYVDHFATPTHPLAAASRRTRCGHGAVTVGPAA